MIPALNRKRFLGLFAPSFVNYFIFFQAHHRTTTLSRFFQTFQIIKNLRFHPVVYVLAF